MRATARARPRCPLRRASAAVPTGQHEQAVRTVERACRLRLRRDDSGATAESIASFLKLVHPDVVVTVTGGMRFSGRDELASLVEEASADWHDCRIEVAGLYPARDGRVLALGCVVATSYRGEPETRTPFANVWSLREGLVDRLEAFVDRSEAEKATGIRLGRSESANGCDAWRMTGRYW
jgi:ketosteroid isomerase-like protein